MESYEEISARLHTLADFVRWGASAFNRAQHDDTGAVQFQAGDAPGRDTQIGERKYRQYCGLLNHRPRCDTWH